MFIVASASTSTYTRIVEQPRYMSQVETWGDLYGKLASVTDAGERVRGVVIMHDDDGTVNRVRFTWYHEPHPDA